jgi:uncharacterized protein (TIGR02646 family)
MYKLDATKRIQLKPQILSSKGAEWTDDFLEKRKINSKYKHSWIKNGINYHDEFVSALENLTDFHCSYCDKYPLDGRAKIDYQIDHFQPISENVFYHLVYEWNNLYLSCGGCNKSKLAQYSDLILRPDASDYIASEYFFFDTGTGEILVNEINGIEKSDRAKKTIEVFKLNHPSIIKFRLRAIKNYSRDKKIAEINLNVNDYDYRNFIEQLL